MPIEATKGCCGEDKEDLKRCGASNEGCCGDGNNTADAATTTRPRRRIVRRRGAGARSRRPEIPESVTSNQELIKAVSALPSDYDFEIFKTVWRIQCDSEKRRSSFSSSSDKKSVKNDDDDDDQSLLLHVALQMPEGLLMYGCAIGDLLQRFAPVSRVSVLGDVTYGACCVDDLGAEALGADLLVHYGHSCLVPLNKTAVPCLYVFVEIRVDVSHAVDCLCETIPEGTRVEVMGTVQFRTAVTQAAKLLNSRNRPAHVPQAKPLSPGEVLGCTAPTGLGSTNDNDDDEEASSGHETVMLFIADGRFHLEAAMIANPTLTAYRYDPYGKNLTVESYDTSKMRAVRSAAIARAREARVFGIILGTLGRQGNPAVLSRVRKLVRDAGRRYVIILLSEIVPSKLDRMPGVDAWVQIACPRLSVDWGHFFSKPVLSPYEAEVCLGNEPWRDVYPMDFYSKSDGEWSNYGGDNANRELYDG